MLDKDALFTPRMYTYNCSFCEDQFKDEHCLGNGHYCPWTADTRIPEKLKYVQEKSYLEHAIMARCVYEINKN